MKALLEEKQYEIDLRDKVIKKLEHDNKELVYENKKLKKFLNYL